MRVIVDSVDTRPVAGRPLHWFRAHLATPAGAPVLGGPWHEHIYEQLGSVNYLQPQSPSCGGTDLGHMGAFTGFWAMGWPGIGYQAGTGTLLPAVAPARAPAADFAAYPNPGQGLLTAAVPPTLAPDARLRLLDLTGRVVRQLAGPLPQLLDVRGLPAGSCPLLLLEGDRPTRAQQLIV